MMTNAQVPNAGFESWTSGNPDNWATSNAFPAGLVNVTQSSDSHTGSSALQGNVVSFFGTPAGPLIQSGTDATGFAITAAYHSIDLWYKFTGVGGDKFSVNVSLDKSGTSIAQGAIALPATMNTYTHLTLPLNYTTSEVPDVAIIQISITGPVTGNDVHTGSVMLVDDISFSLSTGIEPAVLSSMEGKCYPNPSSDVVNIPLTGSNTGSTILKVFDSYGKEVTNIPCQSGQFGTNVFQLSVKDLPPGIYYYSISERNKHNHGKFVVRRF